MPAEDEMTIDERRKYLKKQQERYRKATRKGRGTLLSEMGQVTGMHRKSLTRLLHGASLERQKRGTPRPRSYGPEVEWVIVRVWESRDYICAERLTPGLVRMAQHSEWLFPREGMPMIKEKQTGKRWDLFARELEDILRMHHAELGLLDDWADIHQEEVRRLQRLLLKPKSFPTLAAEELVREAEVFQLDDTEVKSLCAAVLGTAIERTLMEGRC